jgi:hypothetical protein
MTTAIRKYFVRRADVFDDTLTAAQIAAIEGAATDDENFQEGVRSQSNRMIGATNWHDGVADQASDPRSLKTLSDSVYSKKQLNWRTILVDVTVTAAQNWEVLSVAGSETPSQTAAVGAVSTTGAVVAFHTGTFGTHALDEVAGLNAIRPKNLVLVRDSTSMDKILSGGREVFGLLQSEIATDGHTFNDTDQQVQISFVRETSGGSDLEACPVGDIAGKTINYQYAIRANFKDINEQDTLFWDFVDPVAGAGTPTLTQVYQSGNTLTVSNAEGDFIVNLSDNTTEFDVQSGGSSVFQVQRDGSANIDVLIGGTGTVQDLDVNTTNSPDFNQGIAVATAGQTVNVGITSGQLDSTSIILRATGTDATVYSDSGEVKYRDSRETTALPFTDATAGAISALGPGSHASIAAAIKYAMDVADLDIFRQTLSSNYGQDVNVPGGGWINLTNRSIDMETLSTVDTLIFLNGSLLNGGNGTTNNDVYAGDTPANGDLKFDFAKGVKTGDVLIAVSWYV